MFARSVYLAILAVCLSSPQSNTPLPSNPSVGFGIAGIIVDADTGVPVPQARVAASATSQPEKFFTVSTGDDGRFQFANLSPDKYALRAEARGYLTQSFNQHSLFSTAIAVGPNLDSSNIVFVLSRESSIGGAITDETGEAVPDATVLLYQTATISGSKRTSLLQQVIANDEGSYVFPHLLAGRYFVAVSARPWYAQHLPASSQAGSPSGGPRPSGQSSGSRSGQQVISLMNVAYSVTFYPGATRPEDASPIDIRPGNHFVANISLQPVPAVRFRLNSNSGSAVSSVQLEGNTFDGAGIPVFSGVATGPPGTIELLGVAPGHYSVQFSNAGAGNSATRSSREIEVSATGQVQQVPGTQSVGVAATVRLEPGTTLPQAGSIQFRNTATDVSFREELTGAGRLEFKQNLPPGTYEISCENGAGVYVKAISAVGATSNGLTLQIKGASPVQLHLVLGRASANVTGVALRESRPFAGGMIVLVPTDPAHNHSLFRMDESDSDGTFSLPAVVSGDYTLLALAKGWDLEWQNPAVLKPYLVQGQAVHVQENGTYHFRVQVQ